MRYSSLIVSPLAYLYIIEPWTVLMSVHVRPVFKIGLPWCQLTELYGEMHCPSCGSLDGALLARDWGLISCWLTKVELHIMQGLMTGVVEMEIMLVYRSSEHDSA